MSEGMMIETPKAGRELDMLIGERIFGWKRTVWHNAIIDPDQEREYGMVRIMPEANVIEAPGWFGGSAGCITTGGERIGDVFVISHSMLPRYSSDLIAAWKIIEYMREHAPDRAAWEESIGAAFKWAHRYSASEVAAAICRSALAALAP